MTALELARIRERAIAPRDEAPPAHPRPPPVQSAACDDADCSGFHADDDVEPYPTPDPARAMAERIVGRLRRLWRLGLRVDEAADVIAREFLPAEKETKR